MQAPSIEFHGNLSSVSRVDTCGQTERRTDMTKILVALRDYANAPKTPRYYDAGSKQQYPDARWLSYSVKINKTGYIQCDSFGTRPKKMRISQRIFIGF